MKVGTTVFFPVIASFVFFSLYTLIVMAGARLAPVGLDDKPPVPMVLQAGMVSATGVTIAEKTGKPETGNLHDHADNHHDEHHARHDPHVHGHAELAISRDDDVIATSLQAPLADFGLSGTGGDIGDENLYTDRVLDLVVEAGADCVRTTHTATGESDGQHGTMRVDLTFICANVQAVIGVRVTAFGNFPGFETVDAVILTASGQTVRELTPTDPVIRFR